MNVCYYVQKQTGKVISATEIWKHLETLYDLPALDELVSFYLFLKKLNLSFFF